MSQPHGPNCWNTAKCPSPNEQCFVQLKTAAAGLAHCRATCPSHGWLCETRVPDENGGAACGPAPLPKSLVQPTDDMHAVMAEASGGAVKLCDRANPPRGVPTFEITCYDGGQTGNRYVMVKSLLARAACCGGIALLPPEFDHFPQSGAACFDFRGAPSALSRPGSAACAANVSENSKRWWGPHLKQTEAHCPASAEAARLVALAAKVYVGFGVPGLVFRDRSCAALPSAASASAHTLHIHMRSGEIFTNWQNGSHLTTHGGFQHEPWSRGQPPLSFYAAVAAHAHPGAAKQPSSTPSPAASGFYDAAVLATSPDRSNPVAHALLQRPGDGSVVSPPLGLPLRLASSDSFLDDLSTILCARHLVLARSSLNSLLMDSPNLHDLYEYAPTAAACEELQRAAAAAAARSSAAAPACADETGGRAHNGGSGMRVARRWCVAPRASAGRYSVYDRWANDAAQRAEMVEFGMQGGGMNAPLLVSGGGGGAGCRT